MNKTRWMGLTRTTMSGSSWRQPSLGFQVLPALCYLQGWMPRGVDELIKWLMSFREIENLISLKEPDDKIRMFRTLLKGQALSSFEHHLRRRLEAEDSELSDNALIELVIRELKIGLE
jgi:hypothetical protein